MSESVIKMEYGDFVDTASSTSNNAEDSIGTQLNMNTRPNSPAQRSNLLDNTTEQSDVSNSTSPIIPRKIA